MWDKRYDTPDFVYGEEPNTFLVENVHHLVPGSLLCLAEGEGRNGVYLAQNGFEVTAVDASSVGLEKAMKLAARNNVELLTVVTDLAEYVIEPESVDNIVSIFCHLPTAVRKKVHRDAVNGLRPGGVLLLEAYTPDQLLLKTGGPPVKEMLMTLEELRSELTGLEFILAQEIRRPVIEGFLHTGVGAVVQVVARKP